MRSVLEYLTNQIRSDHHHDKDEALQLSVRCMTRPCLSFYQLDLFTLNCIAVRSRPQVKRFTPPRKLNSDEESESGSDYSDSEYSSDYSDSEDYSSE